MGRSHAVSGLAGGIALFSPALLPLPGGHIPLGAHLGGMSLPYVALACVVLAICALLPDWDTPSSYVSTALPPLTTGVSRLLAKTGHRTFTHSPIGFAVFGLLTLLASAPVVMVAGVPIRPGNGFILALGAAMSARALGVSPRRTLVLWGAGFGGFIVGALLPAPALWFMPVAVVAGMWIHRLGDALTTQGVPCALWPLLSRPRLRLPLLGDAGSMRERVLMWLMLAYVAWGLASMLLMVA